MSELGDIRAALETQLGTVPGIPPLGRRQFDNTLSYNPVTGQTWVRAQLFPTTTRPAVIGPSPQLRIDGLFVVSVFTPVSQGAQEADDLADAIRKVYDVDTALTEGSVTTRFDYAEIRAGQVSAPWYQVPIDVKWYAYLAS